MKKNNYAVASLVLFMILFIGFILFWIVTTLSMGAPFFFTLFGVGMLVLTILEFKAGIKSYQNREARYKERQKVQNVIHNDDSYNSTWEQKDRNGFCPFCGAKIEKKFEYCPKCGNHLQ